MIWIIQSIVPWWGREENNCITQALPQKRPILTLVINTKRMDLILPLQHLTFTVPTERE